MKLFTINIRDLESNWQNANMVNLFSVIFADRILTSDISYIYTSVQIRNYLHGAHSSLRCLRSLSQSRNSSPFMESIWL